MFVLSCSFSQALSASWTRSGTVQPVFVFGFLILHFDFDYIFFFILLFNLVLFSFYMVFLHFDVHVHVQKQANSKSWPAKNQFTKWKWKCTSSNTFYFYNVFEIRTVMMLSLHFSILERGVEEPSARRILEYVCFIKWTQMFSIWDFHMSL